ncbi:MAG: hypothetical protein OT477_15040 [Chloroflexi bacterium]|nr:hypothetical protein [Chloroflexota bacterium]
MIEIVKFKLKAEVDETEFQAINERFQREVAPTLPRLLCREATVGTGSEWLSELAHAFMSFIDMSTNP